MTDFQDVKAFSVQGIITFVGLLLTSSMVLAQPSTELLFDQPLEDQRSGFFSNLGGQVAADQFTLAITSSITTVEWYGFYFGISPNLTEVTFLIRFYSDSSGVPINPPNYEESIDAQVVRTEYFSNVSARIYKYSAKLSIPFPVNANEQTWISIAEVDAGTPPSGMTQWLWNFSPYTPTDTKAYQHTYNMPPIPPNPAAEWVLSHQYGQLAFSLIGLQKLMVSVDVKPGSDQNCVNINGHGVIPVAVLGSADFDVNVIDSSTLVFAGLQVRNKGNGMAQCSIEDVGGDFSSALSAPDGYLDLVCKFVDNSEDWVVGDGIASVAGELFDGTPIEGSDSICIVP